MSVVRRILCVIVLMAAAQAQLPPNQVPLNDLGAATYTPATWFFDGSMTAASTTLTSISQANFAPSDVGKSIYVLGAGPSGGTLSSVISSYVNPLQVNLSTSASTSVSNATVSYCCGATSYQGGLYESGTNTVPTDHSNAGFMFSGQVQPLDVNGNPSSSGLIVLLSVGMSNAKDEFSTFLHSYVQTPPYNTLINPAVAVVNGALDGIAACSWTYWYTPFPGQNCGGSLTTSPYDLLTPQFGGATIDCSPPTANCPSHNQVQVIWVKQANSLVKPFPPTLPLNIACPPAQPQNNSTCADALYYEYLLAGILRAIKIRYPNVKLAFLTSRIYGGYGDGPNVQTKSPEPFTYEYGFSTKWLIQAQIDQADRGGSADPIAGNLAYSVAPWTAWGPYIWANGPNPRHADPVFPNGLVWCHGAGTDGRETAACTLSPGVFEDDLQTDNVHPNGNGQAKVAAYLWNFFSTSPYSANWFLVQNAAAGATVSPSSLSFPNTVLDTTSSSQKVTLTNSGSAGLTIASVAVSSNFGQTNDCGPGLSAGGSCTINVTFVPTSATCPGPPCSYQGTVTISDDAPGSPQAVQLNGIGTASGSNPDFALSIAPGSVSSATVTAGQTATYSLVLVPVNGFSQPVSLSCSGAPPSSICTATPSSITPNGSIASMVSVTVSTVSRKLTATIGSFETPATPQPLAVPLVIWFSIFAPLACLQAAQEHAHTKFLPRRSMGLSILLIILFICPSCGGNGNSAGPGTPPGAYTITVSGTSGALKHSAVLTLTVN